MGGWGYDITFLSLDMRKNATQRYDECCNMGLQIFAYLLQGLIKTWKNFADNVQRFFEIQSYFCLGPVHNICRDHRD